MKKFQDIFFAGRDFWKPLPSVPILVAKLERAPWPFFFNSVVPHLLEYLAMNRFHVQSNIWPRMISKQVQFGNFG